MFIAQSNSEATLILDQEVGQGNTSFGVDELFAQSFTVGISGKLRAIEVVASGVSEGVMNFSVGLVRACQDGTPPIDWQQELLFYESYSIYNNPYHEWYRFKLRPIKVLTGEQFFIILENDPSNLLGHVSTRGYTYALTVPLEDQYPDGALWTGHTANGSPVEWEEWRDLGADMAFRTYVKPVPEPATILLVGSGLAGLAALRRRFRK